MKQCPHSERQQGKAETSPVTESCEPEYAKDEQHRADMVDAVYPRDSRQEGRNGEPVVDSTTADGPKEYQHRGEEENVCNGVLHPRSVPCHEGKPIR